MMRLSSAALLCLLMLCAVASAQSTRAPKRPLKEQRNKPPSVRLRLNKGVATLPFKCGSYTSRMFPEEGAHVTVNAEASNPEGNELSYHYAVSGGSLSGSGPQVNWDLNRLVPGDYQISVTVEDKHGHKASDSASVRLTVCTTCDCPCTSIILSGPAEAEEGEPVTITANISGGEPDQVFSFHWSVSAGTIIAGRETSAITIDTRNVGETTFTVTLDVGGMEPTCGHEATSEVKIRRKGAR